MALRIARLLSFLFQPLLTGLYLLLAVALLESGSAARGIGWAAFLTALTIGVPAADIGWRVRLGRVGDFQLAVRQERLRPLLIALACTALGLILLAQLNGPPALLATLTAALVSGAALTAVTTLWKISFHAGTASAGQVLLFWYGGPIFLLTLPLLLAVAWARIRLCRHTPAQVVAGGVAGATLCAAVLYLLSGPPILMYQLLLLPT